MALTKKKKTELLELYEGGLAKASSAFLIDYQGINVNEVTELRAKIRGCGADYTVVKNTLALRAIEGKPLGELSDQFRGNTAIAHTEGDVVALAKLLNEFAKQVPALEFKGGVVDGQAIAAGELEEIAQLPSREELIAKLLFLLQSPIVRLVRGLAAIPRQFVVVLDQVAKQRS